MSEIEAGKNVAEGKVPCGCPGCPDCADSAKTQATGAAPDNNRRKFLLGGVIATPAVLLLSSRPVLATGSHQGYRGCTASANASVNLSRPMVNSCPGNSPGCWKNTRNWPTGFIPGLPDPTGGGWQTMFTVSLHALKNYFKQKYDLTGSNGDTTAGVIAQAFKNHNATATLFNDVVPHITYNGSFMQALHYGNAVQKHTASAFLNAAYFGAAFGYTVQQLYDMIVARHGDAQLASDLIWLGGDRGAESCPSDGNADSPSKIDWPAVLGVAV